MFEEANDGTLEKPRNNFTEHANNWVSTTMTRKKTQTPRDNSS